MILFGTTFADEMGFSGLVGVGVEVSLSGLKTTVIGGGGGGGGEGREVGSDLSGKSIP